ncbi:FHA domain-containing protein [Teredinibacter purpureus]|uniref:FHA domain-containing protein n=1 Tax=Teredinibacter purpureus TaxID=2731756 RepID=UPI000696DD00|nr:FHA domain-containing protein [Teredinibacter purpureus]
MSRFGGKSGNDAPTRLVRNDPTKKVGFGGDDGNDGATQKIDASDNLIRNKVDIDNNLRSAVNAAQANENTGNIGGSTFESVAKSANPKTVVFRPSEGDKVATATDLPVVAWLVVVEGAGKGKGIALSYGMQKIGREASQNVVLDFGDETISREHHAAIEYDPKTRTFYLSKGENLVYLNGARVGQGSEENLSVGDMIEIGNTKLKFMPFCGPDFCWQSDS